ncbi:hypothetical protein DFJ73DRAFT_827295 [Zopfochytrium polystomum]|nr:hypothetical protein DFJ73DRAFT_827295 [Zopfochytrium polystomum]
MLLFEGGDASVAVAPPPGSSSDGGGPAREGWTALHDAVSAGHLDCVKTLLDLGRADPDAPRGADGAAPPPLLIAAAAGNLAVVKALVAAGADVGRRSLLFGEPGRTVTRPTTAIEAAERGGFADVVSVLREAEKGARG